MQEKNIGLQIVLARTEKGLSQSELSKAIGRSRQTIYEWEKGISTPNLSDLKKIADITAKDIFFFIATPSSDDEKNNNLMTSKIRQAIKEAGLTQQKLADKLGVTNPVVNVWVTGKRNPTIQTIKRIAKATGKPYSFFIGDEQHNNTVEGKIELTYIPVRGLSSASGGKFILEETETFLPFKKSGPNQFAIKIVGDCMVDPDDPRNSIYDGDYVIVDPDVEARNGDVIVARLDGEYSTVKRMYRHGEEVRLVPDNPEYAPIIRTAATFIVGKVIDVYRPVRAKKERNN